MVLGAGQGLEPAGLVGERGSGGGDLVTERIAQVVVAVKADGPGQADQGVGLDAGRFGQLAHRELGDRFGAVEYVAGRLADLGGEVVVGGGQPVQQLV